MSGDVPGFSRDAVATLPLIWSSQGLLTLSPLQARSGMGKELPPLKSDLVTLRK